MLDDVTLFGICISLYDFFNFFGWVLMFLYNLSRFNEKKELLSTLSWKFINSNEDKKQRRLILCTFTEIFILSCVQFFPGIILNRLWGYLVTDGCDNYFGFALWAPFVFVAFCMCIRVSPLKQLDLFTPSYALSLASFKVACFAAGCCYGKEWKYGVYNKYNYRYEVPVQLIECVVAIVIFIVLYRYNKRKHIAGTTFPLYLILYSGTRFFTEFLRDDFPLIIGPFSTYHIQNLIGVIVGIVEMCAVCWLSRKYDKVTQCD